MIKIGRYVAPTNIFLAPMSGCTDSAFRLIAREHGARFCFFEMVDANALCYGHKKTKDILKPLDEDTPIAAQLLGAEPSRLLDAGERLLRIAKVSFLDINSACPAKKAVKKGAGAALLKKPRVLFKIIRGLSSSLPVPVTVKLRVGYEKKDIKNISELARGCQDSGASAVFLHGRTKSQGYEGDVDYDAIKKVKENLAIPLFGSGNILNARSAKEMFGKTGCDGILIARGALGNPWIFRNIERYLKDGGIVYRPDLPLKSRVLKRHLAYIQKYKESISTSKVGFMRKVAMWYLKDIPKARRIRERINYSKSYEELVAIIDSLTP